MGESKIIRPRLSPLEESILRTPATRIWEHEPSIKPESEPEILISSAYLKLFHQQ
jgi:hypothetical protein